MRGSTVSLCNFNKAVFVLLTHTHSHGADSVQQVLGPLVYWYIALLIPIGGHTKARNNYVSSSRLSTVHGSLELGGCRAQVLVIQFGTQVSQHVNTDQRSILHVACLSK